MTLHLDEYFTGTWFFFEVILNGILCTFGMVGNLISLIVLRRMKKNTSNVFLLFTLALVDMLILMDIIVSHVIPGTCKATGNADCCITIQQGFWIHWPLGTAAHTAGTWLIVAITCDRYLAVWFPFKVTAWNMPKKTKRVIAVILLAAVLFNIPRFFGKETAYHKADEGYENNIATQVSTGFQSDIWKQSAENISDIQGIEESSFTEITTNKDWSIVPTADDKF